MERDALVSACGRYRYWLTRAWDQSLSEIAFVMLNPSRADHLVDDPTIRRCIGFAKDAGFGRLRVVNLFALRTAYPGELKTAPDPAGPENAAHLDAALASGSAIVAAWGAHGAFGDAAARFVVRANLQAVPMLCLGRTREGHPRHPLYVKTGQPFAPIQFA
mgnify:CR=1 FL=1